jgi:hypothetical protein
MISKLEKGSSVTLLDTDKGNDVINACNRNENIVISPASAGSVEVTDSNILIKLTGGASGDLTEFTFVNNEGVLATYEIPARFIEFP